MWTSVCCKPHCSAPKRLHLPDASFIYDITRCCRFLSLDAATILTFRHSQFL